MFAPRRFGAYAPIAAEDWPLIRPHPGARWRARHARFKRGPKEARFATAMVRPTTASALPYPVQHACASWPDLYATFRRWRRNRPHDRSAAHDFSRLRRRGSRARAPRRGDPSRNRQRARRNRRAERELKMRVSQLWHWIYHRGAREFSAMRNIARPLLEKLAERHDLARPEVVVEQVSADGTRKWLMRMPPAHAHDKGAEIECVYIPEADRGTLCVSSQVGCTLNCTFCHTGTMPLVRNLTAAEIVAQVLVARDRLGDFPGGTAPTDGLVPSGEGRARGLQHRLHGHGRAALQFRRGARRHRHAHRRRRAFAVEAAHHGLHLRRRSRDGAARRRMRDDAGGVAARDQQRAARQARAAEPQVSDRAAACRRAATIPARRTRGASPSNM